MGAPDEFGTVTKKVTTLTTKQLNIQKGKICSIPSLTTYND